MWIEGTHLADGPKKPKDGSLQNIEESRRAMINTENALVDRNSINVIRFLAVDTVQKAGSGHPGTPMGAAAMAYTLWDRFLKHNPENPDWPDRDRFVLSPGHASTLLYALLHLYGYDLPLEELKRFRQWGSKTPGHPERVVEAARAQVMVRPSGSPDQSLVQVMNKEE